MEEIVCTVQLGGMLPGNKSTARKGPIKPPISVGLRHLPSYLDVGSIVP